MNNISILNQEIRTMDGLFSLNDLHKASGGAEKHSPNRFTRLEQTQGLINEINQTPNMALAIKTVRGGLNPGTYGCHEIIYAYAMWISSAFYLKVIRYFHKGNTQSQLINLEQQQIIKDLINRVAHETELTHQSLYPRLHNKFKIPRYQELPANLFDEAVSYLKDKLPQAQMFYGLRDGRYLLSIQDGQTMIKDLSGCSIVDTAFTDTLRKNFSTLSKQLRLLSGEETPSVIDLPIKALPELQV